MRPSRLHQLRGCWRPLPSCLAKRGIREKPGDLKCAGVVCFVGVLFHFVLVYAGFQAFMGAKFRGPFFAGLQAAER